MATVNLALAGTLAARVQDARGKTTPPFTRTQRSSVFPLSISGQFLMGSDGFPFLVVMDSPWSIVAQLTNAQIDTYLNDRQIRGVTAILIEGMVAKFTSQTPTYNNVDGVAPFTSTGFTTCSFESMTTAYWSRVRYVVDQCKIRGMVVFMTPAYLGFGGGVGTSADEGYNVQVTAASDANLFTFGVNLATLFDQGNVIWVMGGDYNTPSIAKSWNIMLGIRSVRTTDIVTLHAARGTEGVTVGGGQPGFNLNSTYCLKDGTDAVTMAWTAWARGTPQILLENGYEGDASSAETRRSWYGGMIGGACGVPFGNQPIWGFGEPNVNGGAGAAASLSSLNSTGAQQFTYFKNLFASLAWQKRVPIGPSDTTTLVTTSQGSGTTRIVAARASDGTFALVFTPHVDFTIAMSAITHSSVRARWYDTTAGTYTDVSGTPFANTGTHAFTAPTNDSVLVLD